LSVWVTRARPKTALLPAWSPTGDTIIFQAGDETPFDLKDQGSEGHTSDLWIVRPDGSGPRQLTHQGPTRSTPLRSELGRRTPPHRVTIYATD